MYNYFVSFVLECQLEEGIEIILRNLLGISDSR